MLHPGTKVRYSTARILLIQPESMRRRLAPFLDPLLGPFFVTPEGSFDEAVPRATTGKFAEDRYKYEVRARVVVTYNLLTCNVYSILHRRNWLHWRSVSEPHLRRTSYDTSSIFLLRLCSCCATEGLPDVQVQGPRARRNRYRGLQHCSRTQ